MSDKLVEHQIELEILHNKNNLHKRIRKEFEDSGFESILISKEIPVDFGMDFLVQMALYKRCDLKTLCGLLRNHTLSSQLTADLLLKCVEQDLADYNTTLEVFIVRYEIDAKTQEELDKFQFPLPMVCKPKRITSNTQSGYLKGNGSIILKNNFHTDDVCLDHINRMNSIALTIDQDVFRFVKNSWRNLDKPKDGESKEDFDKRVRAFEKYDRTAKEVIEKVQEVSEDFYLTHKYCKRGRTYSQGYHVNYQGTDWNKACILFANKELPTG